MLTAGCGESGSSSNGDDQAKSTQKALLPQRLDQPKARESDEPKAPPAAAPFSEQLAHELRERTLDMAGADGTTTARCPGDVTARKGVNVTCATSYEGHHINWRVTIGDEAAWMQAVEFEATPSKGILTREAVSRLLFGNYKGSIDYALCNNIPEVSLVPLDQRTRYQCEVVLKGEKPTGLAALPIRVTENGPRAF